jgi:hypothetical protein
MMFSRRNCLLLVLLVSTAMFFTACGSGDWEKLSRVGNTWEYLGEVSGARITAKVLDNWKVGNTVYAEVAPNHAVFSNVSKLCVWDSKNREFIHAGNASLFNEGTKHFFIENRVMGAMKGNNTSFTNADGTVIRYLGEEKIRVPAGEFGTFKFSHMNEDRKIDMYVWYSNKSGVVRMRAYGDTWNLTKFSEGKKADPKTLGGANADRHIAFIQNFFKAAQTGEVDSLQRFFSPVEGREDFARQRDVLRSFVRRASGVRPDQATYTFLGASTVGIRFLQYEAGGVMPTVVRTDAVLELVLEGRDVRVGKINITFDTLY